jgi:CheY-like chemotaxis protein
LLDAGYPVAMFRVVDGETGLAFLKRKGEYHAAPQPDLVIVDLNLPRASGLEILREMQADPHLRHIPSVVLTTSDDESDKRQAEKAGSWKYVTKPMDYEVFLTEVQNLCSEFLQPKNANARGDEPD